MANRPARTMPRGPRQAARDTRQRARAAAADSAGPTRADQRTAARLHERQERREAVIYARNWRTPLIVDVVGGAVVFVAGAVLAALWSPFIAGGVGALGGLYAVLAVRRWRQWAGRRRTAGLDT